jgi:hypothetical protein
MGDAEGIATITTAAPAPARLPYQTQIIFACVIVSHLAGLPALRQLVRRRWVFEGAITFFTLSMSLLYHLCQTFNITLFLHELQWHWLDNIAVISALGMWMVYLCDFRDPRIDSALKVATLLCTTIVQVPDPWNINYTIGPIAFYALLPIGVHTTRALRTRGPLKAKIAAVTSRLDMHECRVGMSYTVIAFCFFVRGLDDPRDPYRFYHGMWHVFAAASTLRSWRIVKNPIILDVATVFERLAMENDLGTGKGQDDTFGSIA